MENMARIILRILNGLKITMVKKKNAMLTVLCNFCGSNFSYVAAKHNCRKYKYSCTTCIRACKNKPNPNQTHGLSRLNGRRTKHYHLWNTIKSRVFNEKNPCYKFYGGAGIKLYGPWNDFATFRADTIRLGYVNGGSILRKNKKGDYVPENVYISKSKGSGNVFVYKNRHYTLSELILKTKSTVTVGALRKRLKKGMTLEEAISSPKNLKYKSRAD